MENIFTYKGYEGTAIIDSELLICRGKILFINDLVTYEADSPKKLKKAFEEAVDDYLKTCAELKREPLKPLKGLFNVRVPPALHKDLVIKAMKENISLNELVVKLLSSSFSLPATQKKSVRTSFIKGLILNQPTEIISEVGWSTLAISKPSENAFIYGKGSQKK